MNQKPVKKMMLVYPVRNGEILLGLKKRGFGEGKWNGFGGKVHEGETLVEAAIREVEEEVHARIVAEDLQLVAHMRFFYTDCEHDVHVFFVERWTGTCTESEEMRPQWFQKNALPYDRMWDDDRYWMPEVFGGRKVQAVFQFDDDNEKVVDVQITDLT